MLRRSGNGNMDEPQLTLHQGSWARVDVNNTDYFELLRDHWQISNKKSKLKAKSILLVLSQDCDIHKNKDQEFCIELVAGTRVNTVSSSIQFTQSAQKLPIQIENQYYELDLNQRFFVPKEDFFNKLTSAFSDVQRISRSDLDLVRDWMFTKYARHPFPDRFDMAFKPAIQLNAEAIGNLQHTVHSVAVFVDEPIQEQSQYHCHVKFITYPNISVDEKKAAARVLRDLITELGTIQSQPKSDKDPAHIRFHLEEGENTPNALGDKIENWAGVVRPDALTLQDYWNCQIYNVNYLCY